MIKSKELIIFLDLDDTIFDTTSHMRNIVMLNTNNCCIPPDKTYLTTENTQGEIGGIVGRGEFMRTTPLIPGMYEVTNQLSLYRSGAKNIRIGVCTHRGYHEKAKPYSQELYAKFGFKFDHEHYLNSKHHPDKIAFLERYHKGSQILLIDDNPRCDSNKYPHNVLLVSKPWSDVDKANTPRHVIDSVSDFIPTLSWWLSTYG